MVPYVTWIDVLDILLVSFLVYQVLLFVRETQAGRLLLGLIPFFVLYLVSELLGLRTVYWFMGNLATVIALVLVVVFQPELRRSLELLGRRRMLPIFQEQGTQLSIPVIKHIIDTVETLSQNKWGGIILIERSFKLNDYVKTGLLLGAEISSDLLVTLFNPTTVTHDGAVVVRDHLLLASNVLLPLSKKDLDHRFGTRHRAAIGATEHTDAVGVVVSEETGQISIAEYGIIYSNLTKEKLSDRLFEIFHVPQEQQVKPT